MLTWRKEKEPELDTDMTVCAGYLAEKVQISVETVLSLLSGTGGSNMAGICDHAGRAGPAHGHAALGRSGRPGRLGPRVRLGQLALLGWRCSVLPFLFLVRRCHFHEFCWHDRRPCF